MEYVSGVTLAELLARRGPQPLGMVTKAVSEVLAALAAAHAHAVIHRDQARQRPRHQRGPREAVRFRIAKADELLRPLDSPHTRTGSIMGTPAYMSPEQVRSGEVDGRADLYAVGATGCSRLLPATCRSPSSASTS